MLKIKQALFLIFGITSFIIFYIGFLNYITTEDEIIGIGILAFSIIASLGTIVATFYISNNITKPIESLARRMSEFSKTNTIQKTTVTDKEFKELYFLHKDFEDMAGKVGNSLEKEKQLNLELQEIDTRKSEFMSMISHELKTPIMPIKGYVQLLKKQELMGPLSEKQLDALNEIQISATKLEKLIQDILIAQKIELGKLTVEQDIFESGYIVENAFKAFSPICQSSGIDFKMSVAVSDNVYTDSDRIAQVFSNLITNAMAFVSHKRGEIEIGAFDNADFVTFFVKDNGIGISEDQQKNIFKKFYQVDTSSTRKKEGSGLGLSICEGIIKTLGGKIWVNSILNEGTTFYFDLPKAKIPVESFQINPN